MRAVIQRVASASVSIAGGRAAIIDRGLLVLVGIEERDAAADLEWLSGKLVRLRVFADEQGVMNRSVQEAGGSILVHSCRQPCERPCRSRAVRLGKRRLTRL